MYVSGFSENKGQAKSKPGFLKDEGALMVPKKDTKAAPPIPAATTPPTQPHKKAKKRLVGHRDLPAETLPDKFVAKLTVKSTTPVAKLQMTRLGYIRDKWQEEALSNNLKELKQRVKSAKIYKNMLVQFTSLSKKDQKLLHRWIKKHEKAIRKLHSARKMKKVASKTKHTLKLLDEELSFWNEILEMKAKGVAVGVKPLFKNVRTRKGRTVKSSIYDEDKSLPVFKSKVPASKQKSVHMKNGIATFGGDVEMAAANVSANRSVRQQSDSTTIKDYYVKESILSLQKEVKDEYIEYKTLEKEIKKALAGLGVLAKKDAAVISILLEARPERFMVVSTLLEALQDSFKKTEEKTPEKEAEILLKEGSEESSKLLNELNKKRIALETAKKHVMATGGKPSELSGFLGEFNEGLLTSKLGNLLPWLVAGFFIYKIKAER